jgi:DNA topoisomerase-1
VDNNFEPKYRVPNEKKAVVKELKALAKGAEEVYLATDPDREGESISWHLLEASEIDPAVARRVTFHEITEPAIKEAFAHPRHRHGPGERPAGKRPGSPCWLQHQPDPLGEGSQPPVAGRVQSVALRLIVDRNADRRIHCC